MRLDPRNSSAYLGRGNAYRKKGAVDSAIADYSEAIRLDRNHARAYFNRGCIYGERGQIDQAIADYTEAIRVRPQFAFAFCNRGLAYARRHEYVKAFADYNEAIRLDPTMPTRGITEAPLSRTFAIMTGRSATIPQRSRWTPDTSWRMPVGAAQMR